MKKGTSVQELIGPYTLRVDTEIKRPGGPRRPKERLEPEFSTGPAEPEA